MFNIKFNKSINGVATPISACEGLVLCLVYIIGTIVAFLLSLLGMMLFLILTMPYWCIKTPLNSVVVYVGR